VLDGLFREWVREIFACRNGGRIWSLNACGAIPGRIGQRLARRLWFRREAGGRNRRQFGGELPCEISHGSAFRRQLTRDALRARSVGIRLHWGERRLAAGGWLFLDREGIRGCSGVGFRARRFRLWDGRFGLAPGCQHGNPFRCAGDGARHRVRRAPPAVNGRARIPF
jgi:hypothetical protein